MSDSRFRATLALLIVGLSILGVTAAALVALLTAADAESRAEMGRLVFASVLPLFGTWVGTVLAFYYAKDNLQAATESTLKLSRGITKDTPVADVMLPDSRIEGERLAAGDDPDALGLSSIAAAMDSRGRKRWPVLQEGRVVYVIHRSTLDSFALMNGVLAFTDETVADLLAVPQLKALLTAIASVREGATVDEARAAMRAVSGCNDVFVTSTGTANGTVLGWLTNTDLAGVE